MERKLLLTVFGGGGDISKHSRAGKEELGHPSGERSRAGPQANRLIERSITDSSVAGQP